MKWVKKDDSKTIKEVVMRNITVPESEFEIDENKVYRIDRLDEVVSKIKESIDDQQEGAGSNDILLFCCYQSSIWKI